MDRLPENPGDLLFFLVVFADVLLVQVPVNFGQNKALFDSIYFLLHLGHGLRMLLVLLTCIQRELVEGHLELEAQWLQVLRMQCEIHQEILKPFVHHHGALIALAASQVALVVM